MMLWDILSTINPFNTDDENSTNSISIYNPISYDMHNCSFSALVCQECHNRSNIKTNFVAVHIA